MILSKIDFHRTGAFSSIFLDYIKGQESLKPFYAFPPQAEAFLSAIDRKKRFLQDKSTLRSTLHQVLKAQYRQIAHPPFAQIEAILEENTFTVTTGHQLNIFTGPLYFIYKIVTTIKLAELLHEHYPQYRFVPLYWMASEDHDFEEINHFYLFNKKYSWQSEQRGAVGRFSTKEIENIFDEIEEELPLFREAYLNSNHLSEATRKMVHQLFGDRGLLILDADEPALKKQFTEIIRDDVFENQAGHLVESQSRALEAAGYKAQVFPREINFFYLDGQIRERIVRQGTQFQVNNTEIRFSESELTDCIEEHPEKFSPNVVLRPLYQEMILPNLAYTGGPGELAYWLQLKGVFDHYQVPFPILMPRNFALILNKTNSKRFEKLGIRIEDLFLDEHSLKNKFLLEHAGQELLLDAEKTALDEIFEQILDKTQQIDQSLTGFVGAEKSKVLKSLENIEKRLQKAEENKQKNEINQLIALKEKLFPDGELQERHDNLLNFYLNQPEVIDVFLKHFHPFEFNMQVIIDL